MYKHLPGEDVAAVTSATSRILGTDELRIEPFESEGFMTRVYSCKTYAGDEYILRHGRRSDDFSRDKYVGDRFGGVLPVPKVFGIRMLKDRSALCVSERLPGVSPDEHQLDSQGSDINISFAELLRRMHTVDISATRGYGQATATGVGMSPGWLRGLGTRAVAYEFSRKAARVSDIDRPTFREIVKIQRSLEPYALKNTDRRLTHGDLKADNLLSDGQSITGVIDWARFGYYDLAFDLGVLHARKSGAVDNVAHAEAVGADPDTISKRVLYYALGECTVAIAFFNSVGYTGGQIGYENRLVEIANEAETA